MGNHTKHSSRPFQSISENDCQDGKADGGTCCLDKNSTRWILLKNIFYKNLKFDFNEINMVRKYMKRLCVQTWQDYI